MPASFDRASRYFVVFFHGGSSIDRVADDMELRAVPGADINAVLVAPQFAHEAADSVPASSGSGHLRALPAGGRAALTCGARAASEPSSRPRSGRAGDPRRVQRRPAGAFVLDRGGANARIAGVVLERSR
jgi:hypothetical protein